MPPRPDLSAERRAQIVRAALTCFSRKGYAKTTMDDIVAESGLSKGSLYWYFESKDELFMSAVTSALADLGEGAFGAIDQRASPPPRGCARSVWRWPTSAGPRPAFSASLPSSGSRPSSETRLASSGRAC